MNEKRAYELYNEGKTTKEIAAELGVSERQVGRLLVSSGARPLQKQTRHDWTQADMLLAEGMPSIWVAEDTGIPYEAVAERAVSIPGHAEATKAWRQEWIRIARSSRLLDLHYSFAPMTTRISRLTSH